MGFELKSIDDGNSGAYICAPQLEVSGNAISTIDLDSILSTSPGYTRKDNIIAIKLNASIKNTDDTYPIQKNELYEFINNDIIEYFRITDFYDESGNTIIKLYGEKNKLSNFFGILESKILTDYQMEIYSSFKVSDVDKCLPPSNVEFFGITSTSINIKPILDFVFIDEWSIRYRVNGSSNWNTVDSIIDTVYVLKNLQSNTAYDVSIYIKCNKISKNSDYSKIFLFRTL